MADDSEINPTIAELVRRIQKAAEDGTIQVQTNTRAQSLPIAPEQSGDMLPVDRLRHRPLSHGKFTDLLSRARKKIEVDRRIPKFLRRLFRKQGGFNELLLQTLMVLMRNDENLHRDAIAVADHLRIQTEWLRTFVVAHAAERLGALQARTEVRDAEINLQFNRLRVELEEARGELRRLADSELKRLADKVTEAEERSALESAYFRSQLSSHLRLRNAVVNPAAEPQPAAEQTTDQMVKAESLDAYYLDFENAFRGTRGEIRSRLAVYLPYVRAAGAGAPNRPVVDLGCGRGEWLELLGNDGLAARGVDTSAAMVEICRSRGFDVTQGDALQSLQALPDNEVCAITAFHLIEHLPFWILMQLMRECLRVLQPGGLFIAETPNPANVQVGSHFFYRDYTHQRPLPPDSTQFLAKHVGFRDSHVLPLNRAAASAWIADTELEVTRRFNEHFYGDQDYAVIATK